MRDAGTAIKYGWTVVLVALMAIGITSEPLLGLHSLSADAYLLAIKMTIVGMMLTVMIGGGHFHRGAGL